MSLRIADLAHPRLTPGQQRAIDAAAEAPVDLDSESVLAAATAGGVRETGSLDYRVRLSVWLQAGREDEGLNELGRAVLQGYCVRYARQRFQLEALVARHPEILRESIERPLFIAGLPRSGTTNLVNLLALDWRWRSLPCWEALRPFDAPAPGAPDPRRAICAQDWSALDALLPLLKRMHEMSPDHVHEDLELQALDFTTYNIEWTARLPRWRDWYLGHDRTPHYGYLRKALQALQWKDRCAGLPQRRWLLKCPQHLENLGALIQVFPDAQVVLTHRDPAAVLQSAATMIAYGDRVRRREVDPYGTARYWLERIALLLQACVDQRNELPSARTLDLAFEDVIADEQATVSRVLAWCGMGADERMAPAVTQHLRRRSMEATPTIAYDLEADFDLRASEVHERCEAYLSRFPGLVASRRQ